jgi:hypothetical protein
MRNSRFETDSEAIEYFLQSLNDELSAQIKTLLEQKHLYQSVTTAPTQIWEGMKDQLAWVNDGNVRNEISKWLRSRLTLTTGSLLSIARGATPSLILGLSLPNIRLRCRSQQCSERDERQVFRPIWYQDATNELVKLLQTIGDGVQLKFDTGTNQLFFVAFQCQHCLGVPEGFLIRRTGWDFFLDGRSPMEEVVLPPFIPKKEAPLYRDAVIAYQTGKNLAAVFYLRAFIEQFARRQTGKAGKETGEEIMDAYASTLDVKHRDAMPSLREWYVKLSGPMHSADEEGAKTYLTKPEQPSATTSIFGDCIRFPMLRRRIARTKHVWTHWVLGMPVTMSYPRDTSNGLQISKDN